MPIKPLDIFTFYDIQRFKQFSPQDCANWYIVQAPTGKRKMAMYPCMGRAHVSNTSGINVLNFNTTPRAIFKSIDYLYVVVGATIWQISKTYSQINISETNAEFTKDSGPIFFAYLPLVQGAGSNSQTQAVFCMVTDGTHCYIIDEQATTPETKFVTITDQNTPANPLYVAAFANRFVVSTANSTEFRLTQFNCYDTNPSDPGFHANTLFTVPGSQAGGKVVFAQESGIIKQFAVLHNTLYIFTDFETGSWSNIPSTTSGSTTPSAASVFPWKKNTSFNWDYGIADPLSIDVDFGRMVWLAQNRNGLVQFMMSEGNMPQSISTQAINVLLQQSATNSTLNEDYIANAVGFLYQYENSVFYRVSTGPASAADGLLYDSAASLEYEFDTQTWHRCIEADGGRNLIVDHQFFNRLHLVTVLGQSTVYRMAGNIYTNELRNVNQLEIQSPDAYIAYPMRYELITPIISEQDYSEFITDYIEIDFVWGEQDYIRSTVPFVNTVFLVSETSTDDATVYLTSEDDETFLISETGPDGTTPGNIPTLPDTTYNALYKPHIELYVSDDGGISFYTVDSLEFSQLGVYQWRMRWYQCGLSRNRVYKLVAVSPAPIVILGAVQSTRRSSGGAN